MAALAPLDGYGVLWGVNSMSDDGLLLADVNTPQNLTEVGLVLAPAGVTGDVDANCLVNVLDLLRVLNDWSSISSPADIDQNGIVDHSDLVLVILNWST